MDHNALKEHYEERLNRASRLIHELEQETRNAGSDVGSDMARALADLKTQRDELAQAIDRFESESHNAVDDLTEAVDTALGNLEKRLRQVGSGKR